MGGAPRSGRKGGKRKGKKGIPGSESESVLKIGEEDVQTANGMGLPFCLALSEKGQCGFGSPGAENCHAADKLHFAPERERGKRFGEISVS